MTLLRWFVTIGFLCMLVFCACNGSGKKEVGFPDEQLEAVIREQIGKPDGAICRSDIEFITSLTPTNKGIKDISGIEHCTGLVQLWLDGNVISDISSLSGLTGLKDLSLWKNQVSDVSAISDLVNLTDLSISENQISDITPLSGLVELKVLGAHTNRIVDIFPLADLTNLMTLGLGANQISDVSILQELPNLEKLTLGDNLIVDILPLVQNIYLGEDDVIDLNRNPLSEMSVNEHIAQLNERGVLVRWEPL